MYSNAQLNVVFCFTHSKDHRMRTLQVRPIYRRPAQAHYESIVINQRSTATSFRWLIAVDWPRSTV